MMTLKAYLFKEHMQSVRTMRYLAILIGFVLFAIITPILYWMLPILMNSFPNEIPSDVAEMLTFTPLNVVQNYYSNIMQITILFLALALSGTLRDERKGQMIFPLSCGADVTYMVLAKLILHTLSIFVASLLGSIIVYGITRLAFVGDMPSVWMFIRASLLFSLFFCFYYSILLFLSSRLKSGVVAAVITILICWFSGIFSAIPALQTAIYNPDPYLMAQSAVGFGALRTPWASIIFTPVFIAVMVYFAVRSLRTAEPI